MIFCNPEFFLLNFLLFSLFLLLFRLPLLVSYFFILFVLFLFLFCFSSYCASLFHFLSPNLPLISSYPPRYSLFLRISTSFLFLFCIISPFVCTLPFSSSLRSILSSYLHFSTSILPPLYALIPPLICTSLLVLFMPRGLLYERVYKLRESFYEVPLRD